MGESTKIQRVSLREAAEILARQGIEIKWADATIEEFFVYYDRHYRPYLESDAVFSRVPKYMYEDFLDIFNP